MSERPNEDHRDDEPKNRKPKGGRGGVDLQQSKWVIYLLATLVLLALLSLMKQGISERVKMLRFDELRTAVENGDIQSLRIRDGLYEGMFHPSSEEMQKRPDKPAYKRFRAEGPSWGHGTSTAFMDLVDTKVKEGKLELEFPRPSLFWPIMMQLIPWVLFVGLIYFFFFRGLRGAGGPGSVLNFGKSKARLIDKEKTTKTFKDVAGVDEAREEVEEIIGFLRDPDKYQRLGGRIPRGVLLIGAPGTGKTLLAKAIAGEADVPFYNISGSDFVEMFVGVGASRVRDLFRQARDQSPCIIFLDEIDAVGRRRGTGMGGGNDEREQTLNAILVEMDGFESDEKIIVMAATNRPDVLDPALLRPGRFDRHIYVDAPDIKGREDILKVHTQNKTIASQVELTIIAKFTPGFTGADLENLVNEAALLAVKRDKEAIDMSDLEEARDKVLWGREKRSRVIPKSELLITAYHESGHALVGYLLEETDKPHKVSIIPRGPSLGSTTFLPDRDIYNMTRKRLLGEIKVLLAGRISEQIFCDDLSTGAKNDIERATKMVKRMVCEWGMSDALGPINYSDEEEQLFLGREIARSRSHSEETSILIDQEMRRIIDECNADATRLIEEHHDTIQRITDELMDHEVLAADDLEKIMNGHPITRPPRHERKAGAPAKSHEPVEQAEPQVEPAGSSGEPAS